ncbi:MAG: hypothetical protein EOP48_10195 [Sphingobacteriales bacterium]|nr:MAG: hypothetical protein EOP48_10195 [Sphingobacteriales bacterium]
MPSFGVLTDSRSMATTDVEGALDRIFSIGGAYGWHYADWLGAIGDFWTGAGGGFCCMWR